MGRNAWGLAAVIVLLASSSGFAQAPTAAAPKEPVAPTTIMDRAEVRVVRVEILPRSTRSMHAHPDMQFHIYLPITGAIEMNVQGEKPEHLEPWQPHFFKGGTAHAFTNNSGSVVQFLEVFIKKTPTSAGLNPSQALALALASVADAAAPPR